MFEHALNAIPKSSQYTVKQLLVSRISARLGRFLDDPAAYCDSDASKDSNLSWAGWLDLQSTHTNIGINVNPS